MQNLLKNELHLDRSSSSAFFFWAGLAWYLKPFAGIVTDASGRVLTFALISNNAGPTGRTAIDAVAAALRSCGCGS